ncbi:MAG: ABC transporter ATP-binding protein/permease [Treponemataceae bacterium]|nr:ABC transporter ATP-binding protein/permease [Treponemataceae bacterium]
MSVIKKLMQGLEKKYKTATVVAPLTIMGEVLLEVLIPLIMARIIDVGIANSDVGYVVKVGGLMVGAALLSLAFGCIAARFAAVAAFGFSRNLRRRLFNKVQDFSFGNVDKFSTASLVTRLTTDVTNVQNTFQMIVRMCFRAPFMFVSAIVMGFYMNSRLALVFLVCIPLIAIPVGLIMVKTFPRFQKMFKKYDALNAAVQENLIGIRAVKAFVREEHEKEKFDKTADDLRKLQVNAEKLVVLNGPIMMLVTYLGVIAVLWFGGNMIIVGDMQTGELISFITYLTQILMSLMMISMIFVMLNISRASVQRICEVIDEEIDLTSPAATAESAVPPADGSIKFKNVSFSYDKNPDTAVLRDVNLEIPSGAVVGIIGGTGSSKTTLVHLIPRLYDVLDGSVEVGGRDVRSYELDALRSSISMVLQKNVLFTGTIEENLRWGNPNATDEEVKAACVAACADRFISSFPDGYKTVLGQGGVNVSGGQKQRLCIARALLKKPKILILDDSTSAVDTATDASIRKTLRESLPDTTKIIIAQRVASVKDADIIFVLDEGKILDSGTHDSLLKTSEIYREVYESQLKGSGDMDKVEED